MVGSGCSDDDKGDISVGSDGDDDNDSVNGDVIVGSFSSYLLGLNRGWYRGE